MFSLSLALCSALIATESANNDTSVNNSLVRGNSSSDEFVASDTISLDSNTSAQFVSISSPSKIPSDDNPHFDANISSKGTFTPIRCKSKRHE